MMAPGSGRTRQPRPAFRATIVEEDTRRPTMELELAIWAGSEQRYYPMELVRELGGAVLDQLDGRSVVIYVEPDIGRGLIWAASERS